MSSFNFYCIKAHYYLVKTTNLCMLTFKYFYVFCNVLYYLCYFNFLLFNIFYKPLIYIHTVQNSHSQEYTQHFTRYETKLYSQFTNLPTHHALIFGFKSVTLLFCSCISLEGWYQSNYDLNDENLQFALLVSNHTIR